MVDVARLQVEVDSRQVRKAESTLGGFQRSSAKAERSSKSFGNQSKRTAKAVTSMNRSVNLLKGSLGALTAAFSVRAIQQFITSSVNAVDQIGKLSATAGVSAESLQELRFAFGQLAGTTDGDVDAALRRFNRRLGLAADGTGAAKDTFDDLGISIQNMSGDMRDNDVVLDELLTKLARIDSDSRRAAKASEAFGEDAGPRLAAALGEGTNAIEEARQEARDLGIVLSNDAVQAGEAMADQFDIVSRQLGVELQRAVVENKDAILDLVDSFTALINAASNGNVLPEFFSNAEESANGFVTELEKAARIILTLSGVKFGASAGRVGGLPGMIGGGIVGGIAGFNAPELLGQLDDLVNDRMAQGGGSGQTAPDPMNAPPTQISGPEQLTHVDLTSGINDVEEFNRLLEIVQDKTIGAIDKTSVWEDTLKDVKSVMEDDLSNSITDVIMDVDSLSDAFKNLANQIARTVIQRQVSDPLADFATQAIGNIFSGGGVGGTTGSTHPRATGDIPMNANGGNVYGNTPSIVGERGPELFVPGQDGRIVPNSQMGGSGDVTVNIINQGGEQMEAQKQDQRRGPNGEMTVDVMVKSSMERLDSQGQLDGIFRRHGAKRQGQF